MAVRATLQQLRTERQIEARVYHASRQENITLHAKCDILQEELEQSQTSSEQAADAFTRTYDDLQRTQSYSIAQTHHLDNQVIQEHTACLADIEEVRRFGKEAESPAYEGQDKYAAEARLFRQQYNTEVDAFKERGRQYINAWSLTEDKDRRFARHNGQ